MGTPAKQESSFLTRSVAHFDNGPWLRGSSGTKWPITIRTAALKVAEARREKRPRDDALAWIAQAVKSAKPTVERLHS